MRRCPPLSNAEARGPALLPVCGAGVFRFLKRLIRWEKKPQNYVALVQFAAVLIVWRLVG